MCGRCRSAMAPKRKRTTTRRRKLAKRQRRMTYGQVGGVSPGLIVGIGKAGYVITKALGVIKPREPGKYPQNADGKWTNPMHVANPNPMDLCGPGQGLVGRRSVDPMDADIAMSPEYDAGDVDCSVEACYPCWQWLSRLGRSRRNANGGVADVKRSRKKRKAVTFALDGTNGMKRPCTTVSRSPAKALSWRTMWQVWGDFYHK